MRRAAHIAIIGVRQPVESLTVVTAVAPEAAERSRQPLFLVGTLLDLHRFATTGKRPARLCTVAGHQPVAQEMPDVSPGRPTPSRDAL
jgi:hypothetical protein